MVYALDILPIQGLVTVLCIKFMHKIVVCTHKDTHAAAAETMIDKQYRIRMCMAHIKGHKLKVVINYM